jgi:hypothetical protein
MMRAGLDARAVFFDASVRFRSGLVPLPVAVAFAVGSRPAAGPQVVDKALASALTKVSAATTGESHSVLEMALAE